MRRKYRLLALCTLLAFAALLYWKGGRWFAYGAPELKPIEAITPAGPLMVPQKGRWQLIYLWSPHNPFYVEGMHELEGLYHGNSEKLAIFALEVDGKKAPKVAIPWGYLPASLKKRLVKDWKISFLPTVMIVDPRGRVRQRLMSIDRHELKNYLALTFFLDREE
jgi:hypothetical protein